jgi:sugar lactone lactonase YvrE
MMKCRVFARKRDNSFSRAFYAETDQVAFAGMLPRPKYAAPRFPHMGNVGLTLFSHAGRLGENLQKGHDMKTVTKIIYLGICCLALAFSQRASAQPVFYPAAVDNAPLGNRIPLILIHGIESDPSMWNSFLNYYVTHPTLTNNFKPYLFGYQTDNAKITSSDPGDIFGLAPKLGDNLEQNFGTKSVAILSHSMGGLVARAEMEYYSYTDKTRGGDRVLMLITLATPHHGTPLGNVFFDNFDELLASFIFNLYPGFAYNLKWDGYDGNKINGDQPISAIPSSQDYSKIIAYCGTVPSVNSIPIQSPDEGLFLTYPIISGYGYNNDGAVPIGSALFGGVLGIRTRQIDGSCDHFQIYSGQNTVNGGTPTFDSIAADLETVIPMAIPAAPVISSVSPSTLTGLPVGQTQLIRIIGSGFTGSSTLTFNDGVNPSYTGRIPSSFTANELDYYISVGTSQANWTVQVFNGSQFSNINGFTVNAPPAILSGSLVVNLSPAGAVSAGAQWQVDGGTYYSSGGIVPILMPGSHTVSFKSISGYTTPADQIVNITANAQTTANTSYSVIAATTYTLTLNQGGSTGFIEPSPFGTWNGSAYVYSAGSVVQLTANANPGYHFVNWSGDVSGSAATTAVTMNGNKSVSANFASGDPNMGTITVTIQPPEAAAAGVTWGFNANDYRASGTSYSTWPATYWIFLHGTNGWVVGGGGWVTITAGQTTNVTFAASSTTGSIIGNDPRTYFTLAGAVTNYGSADGFGSAARFGNPWSPIVDSIGNVYVADAWSDTIRKITPSGLVSTFAGQAGVQGSADALVGTNASFNNPFGLAIDSSNNLYVADTGNYIIRKITPSGAVSTLAGSAGNPGSANGTGNSAQFNFPLGVAVDTNGNVYVAEGSNEDIRKITPAGLVTTFAGLAGSYGTADGTGSAARFNWPSSLAMDANGNLFVADNENSTIRKITPAGVVTTIAGFPGSGGAADGTGNVARFYNPNGLAVDAAGNIYVADTGNNAIRKVTQAGVVTTLAGQSGNPGNNDGIGSVVRFKSPSGVAIDNSGNLFITDAQNYTIRATQTLTTKVDQTIVFAPLPNKSASDTPFALIATATSGLPVYLNILSGPATLDTNNVLTVLGAGTVNVIAWQPGNSNYNAAVPVQQSFNVSLIPQTITFGALSQQKQGDAPFPLNATADSGLPVSFSIISGPATLSGNILILNGWGTVTVSASQPGNNSYAAATSVTQSFFVTPPDNTIVSPQRLPNGNFQLAFYGLMGSNYMIQTSTNLIDWQLFTNFTGSNLLFYFDDPAATNFNRRFYRSVLP